MRLLFLVVLICLTGSALLVATLYTRDAELPLRTIRHLRAGGRGARLAYDFAEQQRFIEAAQKELAQDSCSRTLQVPKVRCPAACMDSWLPLGSHARRLVLKPAEQG